MRDPGEHGGGVPGAAAQPPADQPHQRPADPGPPDFQCWSFRNYRRSPAGHERAAQVPLAGGGGSVARPSAELAGGERAERGYQWRERLQFTVVSHCLSWRVGMGGNGLLSLTNPLLALPRNQYGAPVLSAACWASPPRPGPTHLPDPDPGHSPDPGPVGRQATPAPPGTVRVLLAGEQSTCLGRHCSPATPSTAMSSGTAVSLGQYTNILH